MTAAEKSLREELRRVGARRERHRAQEEALQEATQEAIDKVRALAAEQGSISMEDAAELLGLHRSTIYEMYTPKVAA